MKSMTAISYRQEGLMPIVTIRFRIFAVLMIAAFVLQTAAPLAALAAIDGKKELTADQQIIHFLNRTSFGAKPGDVERINKIGIKQYLEQQLNADSINDAVAEQKVDDLEIFKMTTAEVFAKYPNPTGLLRQLEGNRSRRSNQTNSTAEAAPSADEQRQRRQKLQEYYQKYDLKPAGQLMPQITANRVLRAVYSERQLQEVMVDFWQNHFNVYSGKAAVRWYIPSYERDVLRKNALGNFKDLVVGTAQHPAMLFFLDNFESVSPNTQQNSRGNTRLQQAVRNGGVTPRMREQIKKRQNITDAELDRRIEQAKRQNQQAEQRPRRGLNENYARELMELHTLGVDGGYTQKDIAEVAKAFSGWTIADPRGYQRSAAGMIDGSEEQRQARLRRQAGVPDDVESGEFYFNDRWHDKNAKTVLGQKIENGGMSDGLKVIDILVAHPSTAKFIAKKLAVKFVSDNPSEAYVERIAKAFSTSKGDIKTTLRAIFTDKEFYSPANYRAKIKTPFELAVSSIRAVGGNTNSNQAFIAMLTKLGEVPYGYQAPTGYPDTAEDWVNTGALLERLNFAVAIASNRIPGTRVDLKTYGAGDRNATLDKAISEILDGDVSQNTLASLKKQLDQPLPEVKAAQANDEEMTDALMRRQAGQRNARVLPPSGDPEVFKVVSLVLGTPEFQRQ